MKANRKFVKGEEAVSAVIGVILMVAITVAIAATVYVYVSGLIGGTSQSHATITMNKYSTIVSSNTVIWMVSGVEGEPLSYTDANYALLDSEGSAGAYLTAIDAAHYNDNDADGYISSGDTFNASATSDGSYVFLITDKASGNTIFKSGTIKYG